MRSRLNGVWKVSEDGRGSLGKGLLEDTIDKLAEVRESLVR